MNQFLPGMEKNHVMRVIQKYESYNIQFEFNQTQNRYRTIIKNQLIKKVEFVDSRIFKTTRYMAIFNLF